MALGPGRFDKECTLAREAIGDSAILVAVLVIDRKRGAGFSMQCSDPDAIRELPNMLDQMSKELRADFANIPRAPERQQ